MKDSSQKTLEKAATKYANEELEKEHTSKVGNFYGFSSSFIAGAEYQIERNKEDFKTFWDAACAYTVGSHKDFKQTHLDFEEFYQKFKQENANN